MSRIAALIAATAAIAFGASAQTLPDMIAAAKPSVVLIDAQLPSNMPALDLPGFETPNGGQAQTTKSSGTGFVIDGAQGLIVTADFNVAKGTDIKVKTSDGRELPAEIVATDDVSQVAVLRVADHGLPALKFCDAPPRVGDQAVNLGYPFRLALLAYAGIVSGTDVSLEGQAFPLLFIDATTHRGTAGAPILAANGCVMGMAIAQFGNHNDEPALNFGVAVPADLVRSVSGDLVRTGHVARSWLGLSLIDDNGLLVSAVSPGGPAEAAGIKPGDYIDGYDNQPVTSFDDMSRYLAGRPVGSEVTLRVRRKNGDTDIKVTTILTPPNGSGD